MSDKPYLLNLQEDPTSIKNIPEMKVDYSLLQLDEGTSLGIGGCGEVFKAKHLQWGPVAFKKLAANSNPDR